MKITSSTSAGTHLETQGGIEQYAHLDVPSMVRDILQGNGWKQDALATRLAVSQSTVSNWLNGKQRPNRSCEFEVLVQLRSHAQTRLWDQASQAALAFDYLCAISDEGYPPNLPEMAKAILCRTLATDHVEDEDGIRFNLMVRAANLPKSVRAMCFADKGIVHHRFVVLVNRKFSPAKQVDAAGDEIFAHVITKLEGLTQQVTQPTPII